MATIDDFRSDVNSILTDHGQSVVVRFRETNVFVAGEYDDYSGTFLAGASGVGFSGLGLLQPLSSDAAGEDIKFLEGGAIALNDSKLYLTGSLGVSGTSMIDIGTSGNTYNVQQIIAWPETGSAVYRKVFVRKVTASG